MPNSLFTRANAPFLFAVFFAGAVVQFLGRNFSSPFLQGKFGLSLRGRAAPMALAPRLQPR